LKLELTEYLYTYNKYLTYAENAGTDVYSKIGVYPNSLKKSDEALVTGSLKDITLSQGTGDTSYIEIPQNESIVLSFKTADSIMGDVGTFSDATPETTAALNIYHQGEGAASKYEISWIHPALATEYLSAVDKTPGTSLVLSAHTITIGSGNDFGLFMEGLITITNNSAGAEWIRIYDLSFVIIDAVKSGVQTKRIYAINTVRMPSQNPFASHIFYPGVPSHNVRNLIGASQEDIAWDGDNVFGSVTGRMYERWIDSVSGSARSNARDADDVIHHPAGIVESILRDEVFAERDLNIDLLGGGVDNSFALNDLRSVEADYYNYAIIYNVTKNEKDYVSDYAYGGGNKMVETSADHAGWELNDKCFLTNIQGDNKINYASFDVLNAGVVLDSTTTSATAYKLNDSGGGFSGVVQVGMIAYNDTDATETKVTAVDSDTVLSVAADIFANAEDYRIYGTRKDWRFIRSIHQEETPANILTKLLYETRAILFTSHNQYKIVALDEGGGGEDTWTEPLKQGGRYMASASLTTLDQLYNDYKINYDYDYGSGEYRKTLFVNKNSYSDELTNGAAYQVICKSIFDDYKRINKFEYNCDWIKGIDYGVGGAYEYHTIAEYFFDKIFNWHSIQRLVVNWACPVSDYLKYEVGDQVILNNTKLIPTGVNNVSKFMIFENPIIPLPGAPIINFRLIEMTGA